MAKTTDYDKRQDQRYALFNSVLDVLEVPLDVAHGRHARR